MRIETLLSPGAIEAVMRPTGKASGLPSAAYTDPQFLALEEKLLFAPGWIYAGRAAELARPAISGPSRSPASRCFCCATAAARSRPSTMSAATAMRCSCASP